MSKYVKNLVMRDLSDRLKGVEGLAVINPRGINATKNNMIRRRFQAQGIKMLVVKNTLVRKAVGEGALKGFESLLDGPSALVYGKQSMSAIARLVLEEKKLDETLELRGAFFDGTAYPGEDGVKTISKMPTREEAIASILGAIVGVGRTLAAAIKGPGGKVGGVLKTIEDKAKEKEEAAPAAAAV